MTDIRFGSSSSCLAASRFSTSEEPYSLEETAKRLEKMKQSSSSSADSVFDHIYQEYIRQPANALKGELKQRHLPTKGRKPDLARRLAEYDVRQQNGGGIQEQQQEAEPQPLGRDWKSTASSSSSWVESSFQEEEEEEDDDDGFKPLTRFCGMPLSRAAGKALAKAQFQTPSPIQAASIPLQTKGDSLILHAETGSGKTLAYLLPMTEQLWKEYKAEQRDDFISNNHYGFILTPTRELAAQVAGIASVLAPPGAVRLVSHPTNLMNDGIKDRGEEPFGGRLSKDENGGRSSMPRLFVGSAKAIHHSLFGDGKMPASPTTKPEAKYILKHTRWLVLDEVDRLLNVVGKRKTGSSSTRHEKPAATMAATIARLTLGKAQVVSASATVGRSLKRELSRVLGLGPKEHPRVIRGKKIGEDGNYDYNNDDDDDDDDDEQMPSTPGVHVGRAVTIPDTVQHYVVPVDSSSTGKLLTSAFFCLKHLQNKKILLVLTKGCGINTQTAIGALQHYRCQPEPKSLLDMLEAPPDGGGTDHLIAKHRLVSGATGIGESTTNHNEDDETKDQDGDSSSSNSSEGYLLVTGEDTVRGLHLDGLDVVLVVGRAAGPDEYTHIAGRTGRAGRKGMVLNMLSDKHTAAITGWEKMLNVNFTVLEDTKDVANVV